MFQSYEDQVSKFKSELSEVKDWLDKAEKKLSDSETMPRTLQASEEELAFYKVSSQRGQVVSHTFVLSAWHSAE